ncbi:MAG: branched-chain amino acid ABC transporter permease, partial [Candidatus Competibacteraceae bacterium]|nr:branched-chain amino acid ABC transporter permease [Candidatus Competibacteraceae bacterium]
LMFLVMAVVLVIRPWGLLGRPEDATHTPGVQAQEPLRLAGWKAQAGWLVLLLGLLALPWLTPWLIDEFTLVLAIEILIAALFAASLHFMMGPGGMVSFGHAAYFGLGAYGAALLVKYLQAPMLPALLAAPLAGGLGALLFGWFCVRLSGVYLAMLTLAFAQIAWSVVFQWYGFTGGDDGILGIWPADWANDRRAFYYLTLLLCGSGIYLLRRLVFSPFGYLLRAGRDSPLRAEAIGIPVQRQQWLAFTVAGACAGLAGGLYVFSKGSIFPDAMAIPRSVDALMMVLLGGVQSLSGPLFGAALYTWLYDTLARLEYWRLLLGLAIIALVLLFPQGLGGIGQSLLRRGTK